MPPPPILAHAGPVIERYDVVFSDVWGVVHDGVTAFPTACAALTRFRAQGGTVILVSNAPLPADLVAGVLDQKGVPRSAWDAIVSSGDIAIRHVASSGWRAIHVLAYPYDMHLFERLAARPVGLSDAEAIVCTGHRNERGGSAEEYRDELEAALARDLPFVCANPDLVVDVGGTLLLCAGSVAALYEAIGGRVLWAGKPHAIAYETARAMAERLRDGPVAGSRILAIGDSLRTDMAGAHGAGIDALFTGCGIHRHEVMTGDRMDPERLARLFSSSAPPAIGALPVLTW